MRGDSFSGDSSMESIEEAAKASAEIINRKAASDPELRRILDIVRNFIKKEKVISYGGTAINELLPESDQFYDPAIDIPDYDMFSMTPQIHAMKLADLLDKEGVTRVEVRPGVHPGTYKVFANYTGVADITEQEPEIFERLWKDSAVKDEMHFVGPNFLRMSIYLELSRPRGDVGRWVKVYKRLQLLNHAHPILCPKNARVPIRMERSAELERWMIRSPVVLMGLHAAQYHFRDKSSWSLPMDLLAAPENIDTVVEGLQSRLGKGIKIVKKPAQGEIIPAHIDLQRKGKLVARVFETTACHSYHKMKDGLRVASIPTILQFFFAFLYAKDGDHDVNRLMCVAQQLVDIAHGSRHERRFALLTPVSCLGQQETLIEVRTQNAKDYDAALKKGKNSPEFLRYFFTYNPRQANRTQKNAIIKALRKTQRKSRMVRNW